MFFIGRAMLLGSALALSGIVPSQLSAQRMGGMTAGIGLSFNAPTGHLDSLATSGYGVQYRRTSRTSTEAWSTGSTFSLNYFPGRGNVENIQFFGSTFDVQHQSEHVYQFLGLGFQLGRTNYKESTTSTSTLSKTSESGFALSGGLGMALGEMLDAETYAEMGITTIFGGSKNSTWFPVRFGIRF